MQNPKAPVIPFPAVQVKGGAVVQPGRALARPAPRQALSPAAVLPTRGPRRAWRGGVAGVRGSQRRRGWLRRTVVCPLLGWAAVSQL